MTYFFSVLSHFQSVAPQFIVSAAALLILNLRNRAGYPLPYIAVFFAYFTFGPVLNWTMDADIYVGTVEERIPDVAWWYAIALTVWACTKLLWQWVVPPKALPTQLATAENLGLQRTYWGLDMLNAAAAGWALFVILRVVSTGSIDKLAAIEAAGGLHYNYLLLQVVLSSAAILTWRKRGFSPLTWLNLVMYAAYCLVTFERDFIFVYFALLIHIMAAKPAKVRILIPMLGIIGVIAATAIFVARSERDEFGISTVLGQGSNLFVDTFVYEGMKSRTFYPIHSYWSVLFHQQPTEYGNLTNWIAYLWAGGVEGSGYGFSIVGEAYMNGGRIAIIVVFFLLALCSLGLFRAAQRYPLALMLSVSFTSALMYAVRGEMATLSATMLAAVLVGVGAVLTSKTRSVESEEVTEAYDQLGKIALEKAR